MKFIITEDGLVNNTELYSDDHSTQQYARVAVHSVLQKLGIKVEEEWEMDDKSIEITIDDNELAEELTHDSEGC